MEERKLLNEACRIHRILGNLLALKVLRTISRAGGAGISLAGLKREFSNEGDFIPRILGVFVSACLVVAAGEGEKERFQISGLGQLFADRLPALMEEAGFCRT